MNVFLIAQLPAEDTLPEYGLAWWDMTFVRVNDMPTPFKTREEAQHYLDVWKLAEQGYAVYELRSLNEE